MNRREFLKTLITGAVLLSPAGALAQVPPDALQKLRNHIADSIERATELESIDPEQAEWVCGCSDGTSCSFYEPYYD